MKGLPLGMASLQCVGATEGMNTGARNSEISPRAHKPSKERSIRKRAFLFGAGTPLSSEAEWRPKRANGVTVRISRHARVLVVGTCHQGLKYAEFNEGGGKGGVYRIRGEDKRSARGCLHQSANWGQQLNSREGSWARRSLR